MQLIVLGMHRSGTSVLAGLLKMMGAYFGPEDIKMAATDANPQGYWERWDVVNLDEFVLRSADCFWDMIADFQIQKLPKDVLKEFGSRASKIVLEMNSHKNWMLKDPRLCVLFELWKAQLEAPVCIHMFRNPLEVAQSLLKRDGIPIHVGIALWEKYNLLAVNASRGFPRLIVSYNQLMKEPQQAVKSIHDHLVGHGAEGLCMPQIRDIESFVRNELYREKVNEDELDQYLNKNQLKLVEAISSGKILANKKDYQVSVSAEAILKDYEKNKKTILNANRTKEHASKLIIELRNQLSQMENERARSEKELEVRVDMLRKVRVDMLRNREQRIEKLEGEVESGIEATSDALKLAQDRLRDIEQLVNWLHVIQFHLAAWRWRAGRSVLGLLARLIGKTEAGIEADHINKIFANFESWKKLKNDTHAGDTGFLAIGDQHEKKPDRHVLLIQTSGLFDRDWYLKEYPDVKESGMNPIEHYVKIGSKENRNPSAEFDTESYRKNHPGVAVSGINPLEHYILLGHNNFRSSMPTQSMVAPDELREKINLDAGDE